MARVEYLPTKPDELYGHLREAVQRGVVSYPILAEGIRIAADAIRQAIDHAAQRCCEHDGTITGPTLVELRKAIEALVPGMLHKLRVSQIMRQQIEDPSPN